MIVRMHLRRVHIPVDILGTAPDVEIAARYGCHRSLVACRRYEAGVRAWRPLRGRGQCHVPRALLPTVLRAGTAAVVAARLGLSEAYVLVLRKRHPL